MALLRSRRRSGGRSSRADRLFGIWSCSLRIPGIGESQEDLLSETAARSSVSERERAIAKQYDVIAEAEGPALSGLETAEMEWAAKILNRSLDVISSSLRP